MAQQIRLEFISDGFREILMSGEVQALVSSTTESIQAKANANLTEESEGFKAKTWQGGYGGGRWIGTVSTTDHESMVAESENKALSKAVG